MYSLDVVDSPACHGNVLCCVVLFCTRRNSNNEVTTTLSSSSRRWRRRCRHGSNDVDDGAIWHFLLPFSLCISFNNIKTDQDQFRLRYDMAWSGCKLQDLFLQSGDGDDGVDCIVVVMVVGDVWKSQ